MFGVMFVRYYNKLRNNKQKLVDLCGGYRNIVYGNIPIQYSEKCDIFILNIPSVFTILPLAIEGLGLVNKLEFVTVTVSWHY